MIKSVIKRDGTREPFDPEKIIRWAEWAAPQASMRAKWPTIVLSAVNKMDVIVESRVLQETLINEFLALETDSAYLVAGRLYASHIRKEIYGTDTIPPISQVHADLHAAGMMRDLGYSAEEYASIEQMLRHDRDYNARHYQLHHIRQKYSLRNQITKKEYETRQLVYMRIAMTVMENDTPGLRLADVQALYERLSLEKLSLPTPDYVNFGTYLRSYASCCLFAAGDTADSIGIASWIAYKMTVASAGLGMAYLIRSAGDPVRSGLIKHQGKLGYIAYHGKAAKANMQNGRGGAGNVFVPVYDPEMDTILGLRDVRSVGERQNRDLHYSMIDNYHFGQKLANGEDVFMWNPFTAPKLSEAFYAKDPQAFTAEYERLEQDPTFEKRYVNSRYIFNKFLNSRSGTGTYYGMDVNAVNIHTPMKEPILSSNLCVAPETLLLTDKGEFEIQTLVGTTQRIWNGEQWSDAPVVKTGEQQPLLKVVTNTNALECTAYHKWYVMRDGKEVEVRTHELVIGDELSCWHLPQGGFGGSSIIDIVDEGRVDDTYCVTEPLRHRAVFNGILTGQCVEILEPTAPYYDIEDLYKAEDHGRGEIAMCNLAAVNLTAHDDFDDADYSKTLYWAYRVIDYTILESEYVFPHQAYTSKARMYAAVGIMNFAHAMARNQFSYDSDEGRQFAHEVAERHMYLAIEASLEISKERGLAPWMHKTLWPEGWTPMATYNRNVDTIQEFVYHRDWNALSERIAANGGIGHSLLVGYMPGEASSKAVGATNNIYPIRELILVKTDNNITTRWSAPEGDDPFVQYESAWQVPARALNQIYAIFQKFTDQGISADGYDVIRPGEVIYTDQKIDDYLYAKWIGMKTHYYQNTDTSARLDLNQITRIDGTVVTEEDCENCKM